MTDKETPENKGENEVDVKVLQETVTKQNETVEALNESLAALKKQLDGISGQLRIDKKEDPKEEPKEDPKQGDSVKALEDRVDKMNEEFKKKQFELDRKEILIENGITSDEDKEMFEGIADLEAIKRIASKLKGFKTESKAKEEVETKKVTLDNLLPKGKESGGELSYGDIFDKIKEAKKG